MTDIRKVAVLGSGVMGSGIAAHLANCGIPTLVFDLDKDLVAKNIKAALKAKPAPFAHKSYAARVEACTYDDAARLGEVDWVVEVVTERMMARGREDDTPESIGRRLELYEAETAPLLSWAEDRGILHVVDGLGSEDEVFTRLQKVIETV